MPTVIRKNERSWAIELITKINSIANDNDLFIKRAGGESTISTGHGNTMFPDVILYGDTAQSILLQGWELKMPDVPIEDDTFIKDAQRKAIALNLNSCLIWNFTYAVLYIRNDDDTFKLVKQWSDTSMIKTRLDVETYRTEWENLLEKIVIEINQYFISGEFRKSSLGDVISNTTITTLLQRNKILIANELKASSRRDSVMSAYIDNWWSDVRSEYENDESDKYRAYAKSIILNWSNRILFAHIIKHRQNAAFKIDELDYSSTPTDANNIFKAITSKCDFYNVFSSMSYNTILPNLSWQDFVELSLFLKSNGIERLNQTALQNILEGSVNTTKREINGQYTTPPELANILVQLTVRDWSDSIIDCCCGTGTIAKSALEFKKEKFSVSQAVETVWACDKYQYPLQVANISMVSSDTINRANRLFQHNALTLTVGEKIAIINPETGNEMKLDLPQFGTVVSNLPFVASKNIPIDDKDVISQILQNSDIDGRSDLYCYIVVEISKILKKDGMIGIITSNSWLGTDSGISFVKTINSKYDFMQVHISGKGRWFKNADVVTTIIILKKKGTKEIDKTQFFLWKKSLSEYKDNTEFEHKLINSALLGEELDSNIVEVATYSRSQMNSLLNLNVSYNSLFHKINWLLSIENKIEQIGTVFHVIRGSRRGWNDMFFPTKGSHNIEPCYLRKLLKNARKVDTLNFCVDSTETNNEKEAFCCGDSIADLTKAGMTGTLAWIDKFVGQKNSVGKPLPQVLKRTNMQWYEMKDNETAEIITMMNPDKRLFFVKLQEPSFIDQRLIGLKTKSNYNDIDLNHALLNSMLTMFYIEASGFGRGLGVLDINKTGIAKCYMLNPNLVSVENRQRILDSFEILKSRKIKNVSDELYESDRENFEHILFQSFGIDEHFEEIRQSLISMQKARGSVRD